jgi:LPXTG-motif cell wall-anchored protein
MSGTRHVATCLLVLGAIALALPAATLAAGGGSAADNQYSDPFASTAPAAGQTATHATTTTAAAATPAVTTAATTSALTATAAPARLSRSSRSLPYTGFDGLLAAVVGAAMMAGGVALRRRARSA